MMMIYVLRLRFEDPSGCHESLPEDVQGEYNGGPAKRTIFIGSEYCGPSSRAVSVPKLAKR
jgi:hypothetical protein